MIQPLNDFVLIKLPSSEPKESKTAFGLLLVNEKVDENKNRGIIEAVGENVTTIKIGDEILYEKWGGTVFEFDKDKFILINAKSILAKII